MDGREIVVLRLSLRHSALAMRPADNLVHQAEIRALNVRTASSKPAAEDRHARIRGHRLTPASGQEAEQAAISPLRNQDPIGHLESEAAPRPFDVEGVDAVGR